MRIVHTSDWHAGRIWKGIARLPELSNALEHLGDFIERERIDLLLVSGDLFDTGMPVAEAERIVFRFFKRVGRAGVQTAVIAGNHDHPARIEAWGTLAELVDVRTVPRPCRADKGGVIELEARSGERAVLGALPFAPTRALVTALELAADEVLARQRFADGVQRMASHLSQSFRRDAVNLLMAHLHLEGARFSGSERTVHLGSEWAALPQGLPRAAHYVALGHIHRPQSVDASPSPTRYAGSPLQLDFGEAGEEKSFVLLDARPGQPVRYELVPYRGGTPLCDVRGSLPELERDAVRHGLAGWLRVTVPLEAPDPDITGKVRRLLPNAVVVRAELPELKDEARAADLRALQPVDLFRAYFRARYQADPAAELVHAFNALREAEEVER